jgi:hypothetical protein
VIDDCIGSNCDVEPDSFDVILSFVESEIEHEVVSVGGSCDRGEGQSGS